MQSESKITLSESKNTLAESKNTLADYSEIVFSETESVINRRTWPRGKEDAIEKSALRNRRCATPEAAWGHIFA